MSIYSDIDLSFNLKADGDLKLLKNEYAIKQSLINIFNTFKGSRRMLPEFASNIYRLLFEPMDDSTINDLKEALYDSVILWENRINIKKFYINPDYENNQYNIILQYMIIDLGTEDEISFILEKI